MIKKISLLTLLVLPLILGCQSASTSSDSSDSSDPADSPDSTSIQMGAWLGSWPTEINLAEFSSLIGVEPDIVHIFVSTAQEFTEWENSIDAVDDSGAINLVTIENKSESGELTTGDVNNGDVDDYFTGLAEALKNWRGGKEIWVRLMHEPNGDWYAWGVCGSTINTADSYKLAFQRIVGIFKDAGAANVKFVFNVNNVGCDGETADMSLYPGDDYVSYTSIDAYNFGTVSSETEWKSFPEIFDAAYDAVTAVTSKTILITETSCAEEGGSKADWITDTFNRLEAGDYPQVDAIIWFNESKERDWRINSSEEVLAAYQEGVQLLDN